MTVLVDDSVGVSAVTKANNDAAVCVKVVRREHTVPLCIFVSRSTNLNYTERCGPDQNKTNPNTENTVDQVTTTR